MYRLLHIAEAPTREEERRAWLRKGEELERRRRGAAPPAWPILTPSQKEPVLMSPAILTHPSSLQEHARAAFEKCGAHPRPGEFLKLVNEAMRATAQPAPPVRLQLPAVSIASQENSSLAPEQAQQRTNPDVWEEIEELAANNELLPDIETPTEKLPAIIAKKQAARRAFYRLPEGEQQEEIEPLAMCSESLPIIDLEAPTEEMPSIHAKKQAECVITAPAHSQPPAEELSPQLSEHEPELQLSENELEAHLSEEEAERSYQIIRRSLRRQKNKNRNLPKTSRKRSH